MMKKILFLEQFSNISGGQRVLLNILSRLDRNKYLPYVAIPSKGELSDELANIDVKYFVLPFGDYTAGKKDVFDIIRYLLRSVYLVPLLVRLVKQNKIDLVYANAPRTFLWGTIAAKMSHVPIVWHLHSILSGFELRLCQSLFGFADGMIAVSRSVAEPFGKDKSKISVLYNGIDINEFPSAPGEDMKKQIGVPNENKAVAFIGQIAKWKGIEDFLRAAQLVLQKHKNVVFLVVGDVLFGTGKQKAYKQFIKDLVRELGIEKQVIFTGKRSDVPKILSIVDILVIPSIQPDPCPLVLFEGMAAAKAVIASNHGGPAEIIRDGIDGKLFDPGSYKELADMILQLLQNPEAAQKIGKNAKQRVELDFSMNKYMSAVFSTVDDLIKKP